MGYDPTLGRFITRDPIGQTHVRDSSRDLNDPLNATGRAREKAKSQFGPDHADDYWLWQYLDGANTYAFVGSNPVNATDPSGLDIFIVGGAHEDIGIGDPCGDARYFSFGLDGSRFQVFNPFNNAGIIYESDGPADGSRPKLYIKTTPEQDAAFIAALEDQVGTRYPYRLTYPNCRTFVRMMFDLAEELYGPRTTPPDCTTSGNGDGGSSASSSNSSSGSSNSSSSGSRSGTTSPS